MSGGIIPTYFFVDGKLYKRLAIVRSENYVVVFSYDDERQMRFTYDLLRRTYVKAFPLSQTAKLLECKTKEILLFIYKNLVPRPSGRSYHISSRKPDRAFWSEEDLLVLRDTLYEWYSKDKYGKTRRNLPSKSELLAKMHGDSSYYVKAEDGSFVKVWKAV